MTDDKSTRQAAHDPTHMLMAIGLGAVAVMVWVTMLGLGGLIVVPALIFSVITICSGLMVMFIEEANQCAPSRQQRPPNARHKRAAERSAAAAAERSAQAGRRTLGTSGPPNARHKRPASLRRQVRSGA